MSSFTTKLQYEKIKKKHFWNRQWYRITAPFEFYVGTKDSDIVIEIENNFVLDFASTPWWIHWLYPPIGWYAKAVAIHDKGYRNHGGLTREWWDNLMEECMMILAHDIYGSILPDKIQRTIDDFYYFVTNYSEKAFKKGNGESPFKK